MFKLFPPQRSALWQVFETTAHPERTRRPLTGPEIESAKDTDYGRPAWELASFAGSLFALDILQVRDVCECFDLLRVRPSYVALQTMFALLHYAGDKLCKSKNRNFMIAMRDEVRKRTREAPFAGDAGAKALIKVRKEPSSSGRQNDIDAL